MKNEQTYKEALQKINSICVEIKGLYPQKVDEITSIATEALEQSEPRMFSESQVLRIMERVDTEAGQTDKIGEWFHVHGSDKKYTTKKILDLLIQSLSPKEGKGEDCEHCHGDGIYIDGDNNRLECPVCDKGKPTEPNQTEAVNDDRLVIVELPYSVCTNFEGSYATSSATKCKWCGWEEWQHKEFKKFSLLPETSNPIATDHTTLEPNQTEVEKVLEKYFPNPDDLVNGRVKNVIIKAMEEYASLARKQVIEEIEEWVNEKDFEQPFSNSASISVFDLITFLNTFK